MIQLNWRGRDGWHISYFRTQKEANQFLEDLHNKAQMLDWGMWRMSFYG